MQDTLIAIYKALPLLLKGATATLFVGFVATIMGFIGGFLLGVANCDKLKTPVISYFINGYVLLIRGTPLYVQVLIVYYALPDLLGVNLSPLSAGIIALSCNAVAYVAEIVRGGMNAIAQGQWEAAYVLGYDVPKTLSAVILPQMIKNNLPSFTNELIVLLKETAILSSIGLLEVTRVAMNLNARLLQPLPVYLTVALIYLVITTSISYISKKIEKVLAHD